MKKEFMIEELALDRHTTVFRIFKYGHVANGSCQVGWSRIDYIDYKTHDDAMEALHAHIDECLYPKGVSKETFELDPYGNLISSGKIKVT